MHAYFRNQMSKEDFDPKNDQYDDSENDNISGNYFFITWYDMIWYNIIWYFMMRYDMIWYDIIWSDVISYDMIWFHMIWDDM